MLSWLNSLTRQTRIAVISGGSLFILAILVVIGATVYNLALPSIVSNSAMTTPSATLKPSPSKTKTPSPSATKTQTPSPTVAPVTPVGPSAPLNATITSAAGDSATVAWAEPAELGTSALAGYNVDISINGQGWRRIATVGPTQRSYRLTGLEQSSSYSVSVTSFTDAGESGRSNSASFQTPSFAPSSPQGLSFRQSACGTTSCSALVSFQASADSGASPIVDYQLGYSTDGGANWTFISVGASAGTVSTGDMPLASSYQVVVIAVNSYGSSSWSNTITVPGAR